MWKSFETGMKDLPGDQVRALPMLITGRLRADRVRQTHRRTWTIEFGGAAPCCPKNFNFFLF